MNEKRGLESEDAWDVFAEGHVSDATLLHKDALSRLEKVHPPFVFTVHFDPTPKIMTRMEKV